MSDIFSAPCRRRLIVAMGSERYAREIEDLVSAGGSTNSFAIIQPDSGTSPTASSSSDTLTITGSGGIVVTGDATTDTITISSSSGYISALIGEYRIKTATLGPPIGSGDIEYDNATQTSATNVYVSHLTSTSVDVDIFLALIKQGAILVIQDKNDSTSYQIFQVSGTPTVVANDYYGFPVTLDSSGGTGTTGFPNNNQVFLAVFNPNTDEKVKVSSNDTTEGYLNGKLVAGSGISLTENNNGANETLSVGIDTNTTDTWYLTLDQSRAQIVSGGRPYFSASIKIDQYIYDSLNLVAVDVKNRQLTSGALNNVVLDWDDKTLIDIYGNLSINWNTRTLYDDDGTAIVDYGEAGEIYPLTSVTFGRITNPWVEIYGTDGYFSNIYLTGDLVLKSPDNTQWKITVGNDGALTTTEV